MVVINCDGASHGNPGPGGWGIHYNDGNGTEKVFYGHSVHATNNEMELTAAIKAIILASPTEETQVFTDSQYVKKGITEWILGWKAKGWMTAAKTPVKNKELWVELDALVSKKKVNWGWVKGHNGDPGNEAADKAATMGANKMNNDANFLKMSEQINSSTKSASVQRPAISPSTPGLATKSASIVGESYVHVDFPGVFVVKGKTRVFIDGNLYIGYVLLSDKDNVPMSISAIDFEKSFTKF